MWIIGVQPDSNRYHGVWNPAMLPLHHELCEEARNRTRTTRLTTVCAVPLHYIFRGDTENRTRGAWFQTRHVTTTTYLQGEYRESNSGRTVPNWPCYHYNIFPAPVLGIEPRPLRRQLSVLNHYTIRVVFTRIWTGNLRFCGPLLYHWAIKTWSRRESNSHFLCARQQRCHFHYDRYLNPDISW